MTGLSFWALPAFGDSILLFYHSSLCPQLSHQYQCTVMSRLGVTVVCTHVSCRKPILGDSRVTLLPHPPLHLITLADGKAETFKAGGSDWGNRRQVDMLICRRGQKTLHLSATRADEAGTFRSDSCCDWNPIAWSGVNSGTKEGQVGLPLMGTQRWGFTARKADLHWLCLSGRAITVWRCELPHPGWMKELCLSFSSPHLELTFCALTQD